MSTPDHISYVEYPCRNLGATKAFFKQVFGWEFIDYGEDYCSFFNQGLNGGFYRAGLNADTANGSALIVFYTEKLQDTMTRIEQAGGKIVKPVFEFPGGRRFHFTEPSGNEMGVWSDK